MGVSGSVNVSTWTKFTKRHKARRKSHSCHRRNINKDKNVSPPTTKRKKNNIPDKVLKDLKKLIVSEKKSVFVLRMRK